MDRLQVSAQGYRSLVSNGQLKRRLEPAYVDNMSSFAKVLATGTGCERGIENKRNVYNELPMSLVSSNYLMARKAGRGKRNHMPLGYSFFPFQSTSRRTVGSKEASWGGSLDCLGIVLRSHDVRLFPCSTMDKSDSGSSADDVQGQSSTREEEEEWTIIALSTGRTKKVLVYYLCTVSLWLSALKQFEPWKRSVICTVSIAPVEKIAVP
ncbi:hypothetical protein C8Q69DRAFT_518765 [Paecilomyces variotii]|uniref:Uncharacterized protein n=1 Tax=Byssochlamys spectabilis TaxID=264951 RepID=A0A443HYQ4_BYSSP|nr:hypothetical protein C8Q69DRAFT_518765 [Paecilomyces variotii]RWQ96900.1 hypothetical protein C8Q69DRAFT_518765 [Paecilomyces variotii]